MKGSEKNPSHICKLSRVAMQDDVCRTRFTFKVSYKFYNIYDENDTIVFVGSRSECCKYLGVALRTLDSAITQCRDIKKRGHRYLTASRDLMVDYERRRKNPVGYKRL